MFQLTEGQMYKAALYVEDFPEGVPFGERLREVIEEEGSSIIGLAKRLHTNRFHVHKLVRHSHVQIPTLMNLADTLSRLPLVLINNGDNEDIILRGPTVADFCNQAKTALRKKQADKGYTARELAELAGVSKPTVERMRAGNYGYTSSIDAVFDVFGYTPVYLLK